MTEQQESYGAGEAKPAITIGTKVFHHRWGNGVVKSLYNDWATVTFEGLGDKCVRVKDLEGVKE